jgi:ABC-type uncharacterized transport system substrate-binding protein
VRQLRNFRFRIWPSTILAVTLKFSLLLVPLAADAQPPGKVPRIGFLGVGSPAVYATPVAAFRQGLRNFGYVDGQNVGMEWQWAEGRVERLPALAAELVQLDVDVILTHGAGILAAKQATTTIPIVMAVSGDPVGSGLVASLARPGGNITGLTVQDDPELGGKRLQFLREVAPRVSRVAVLWNRANRGSVATARETEVAVRTFGGQFLALEVGGPDDFEGVFRAATSGRAGALLTVPDALTFGQRIRIVNFANQSGLPALYPWREAVEAGGLMSYGPSIPDSFRRAAIYVDKILKEAKPADLPIEQPTKFELVINLKTAKALGLTIPQSLLIQAETR